MVSLITFMKRPCDGGSKSDRLKRESGPNELHVITCVGKTTGRLLVTRVFARPYSERFDVTADARLFWKAAVVPAG
jgi:hypothetical protein